jgi:hypothetical protein
LHDEIYEKWRSKEIVAGGFAVTGNVTGCITGPEKLSDARRYKIMIGRIQKQKQCSTVFTPRPAANPVLPAGEGAIAILPVTIGTASTPNIVKMETGQFKLMGLGDVVVSWRFVCDCPQTNYSSELHTIVRVPLHQSRVILYSPSPASSAAY